MSNLSFDTESTGKFLGHALLNKSFQSEFEKVDQAINFGGLVNPADGTSYTHRGFVKKGGVKLNNADVGATMEEASKHIDTVDYESDSDPSNTAVAASNAAYDAAIAAEKIIVAANPQ